MKFPSERFYFGRLTAHELAVSRTLADRSVVDGPFTLIDPPLDLVDTAGSGFEEQRESNQRERANPGQAAFVSRSVRG